MARRLSAIIQLLKYAIGFALLYGSVVLLHSYDRTRHVGRNWQHISLLLDSDYVECIDSPRKVFCRSFSSHQLHRKLCEDEELQDSTPRNNTKKTQVIRHLVYEFLELMHMLDVKAILIEPSIIFCMLAPRQKQILLKRKLPISLLKGASNIVTFALLGDSAMKLDNNVTVNKMLGVHGFKHSKVQRHGEKLISGKRFQQGGSRRRVFTTHHFFVRRLTIIHCVVFSDRKNYLWHAKLDEFPTYLETIASMEDMLFSSSDSIYEMFGPEYLNSHHSIVIPSNPSYFLLQIPSSRMLDCRVEQVQHGQLNKLDMMWYFRLKLAFVASLQQLKQRLHPLLINFWLFGGTLLGWYRECGFIPHTSDVDFTAWAEDIDDQTHFSEQLKDMPHVPLISRFGVKDEGLEYKFHHRTVSIDLFFLYEYPNDTVWYALHASNGFYARFNYPMFDLCSADLLGQKVLLPCQAEELILAEYGINWTVPDRDWNYYKSPKNRGAQIKWPVHMTNRIYEKFL